ncbi:MAG: hypothetical protein JO298_05375, partial [Verrucomicrobia bacterium]|nr:hypothetical protein [Verrucomicrobiota bacterium]
EVYQQSRDIRQKLAQQDPTNTDWQRDVSVSLERVGNVLVAEGKLEQALEVYQQSRDVHQKLAQQDPSNSGWQRDLIVSLYKVSTVIGKLESSDKLTRAREFLQTALNLANKYTGSDRQQIIDGLNLALRNLTP